MMLVKYFVLELYLFKCQTESFMLLLKFVGKLNGFFVGCSRRQYPEYEIILFVRVGFEVDLVSTANLVVCILLISTRCRLFNIKKNNTFYIHF